MNDPGLDEPIQHTSNGVEQDRKNELDFQKEDEQAFLNPRYQILYDQGMYMFRTDLLELVGGGLPRQPFPCSLYALRSS